MFSEHSTSTFTHSSQLLVKHKTVGTLKISALLVVLEVEGPDIVRIKYAGKEMAVLRLILGDEAGSISWRKVAERWGGHHYSVDLINNSCRECIELVVDEDLGP